MAIETQRKIAIVKVHGIRVPVIQSITFLDTNERGQEYQVTFNNANSSDPDDPNTADREITYAWVGGLKEYCQENADPAGDPPRTDCTLCERIQRWKDLDVPDRNQETWSSIDNKTYNQDGPPFFVTHQKTHIINYFDNPINPDTGLFDPYGDPASGSIANPWVAMELIDELTLVDERGQDRTYILLNPKTDQEAFEMMDNDTPVIDEGQGGYKGAYRFDPFQNLVRQQDRIFKPTVEIDISPTYAGASGFPDYHDLYASSGGAGFTEIDVGAYEICSDGYDIHGVWEGGGFSGGRVSTADNLASISGAVVNAPRSAANGSLFSVPDQIGLFSPGTNGEDAHLECIGGSGSMTATWRHQILEGRFHVKTADWVPDTVQPKCVFYGAKDSATIVDFTETYTASSMSATIPNDDPYKYFGKDIPVNYDSVLDSSSQIGINAGTFFVILYSSKFGKPGDFSNIPPPYPNV